MLFAKHLNLIRCFGLNMYILIMLEIISCLWGLIILSLCYFCMCTDASRKTLKLGALPTFNLPKKSLQTHSQAPVTRRSTTENGHPDGIQNNGCSSTNTHENTISDMQLLYTILDDFKFIFHHSSSWAGQRAKIRKMLRLSGLMVVIILQNFKLLLIAVLALVYLCMAGSSLMIIQFTCNTNVQSGLLQPT